MCVVGRPPDRLRCRIGTAIGPCLARLRTVALLLALSPAWSEPVRAQEVGVQGLEGLSVTAVRQIEALLAAKAQRTPAQRKVGSRLLQALAGDRPMRVPASSRTGATPSPVAWADRNGSNWAEVDIRADVTAMLEIVHDLAPGADLYYATAIGGPAQFAANVEALCEAGADVIVDDVYYPSSEPAFQDDMIGQAINAAVADGCFYFSAAGNAGNLNDGTSGTWEGDFAPAGSFRSFGTAHDFGDGGVGNRAEASPLGYYVLHWADPLGASSNDYDLFLVDETGQHVLRSSTSTQDGTQDPIEFIQDSAFRQTGGLRLVVVKAADAEGVAAVLSHKHG